MIKLPNPSFYIGLDRLNQLQAGQSVATTITPHQAFLTDEALYTKAQLRQAMRDVLEDARKSLLESANKAGNENYIIHNEAILYSASIVSKLKEQL